MAGFYEEDETFYYVPGPNGDVRIPKASVPDDIRGRIESTPKAVPVSTAPAPAPVTPPPSQRPPAPATTVAPGPAPAGPPTPPPTAPRSRDEVFRNVAETNQRQQDAQRAAIDAKARQDEDGARALVEEQAKFDRIQAENKAANDAQQAALDEDQAKLKSAIDEMANAKLDPKRVWTEKNGASKFLTVLMWGLGSGVAVNSKDGRNPALDAWDRQVNDDLELQKAELENKKAGINAKSSLYSTNLQRFGNDRAARSATEAQFWTYAQNRVKAEMARSESEITRRNGELLILGLEEKKNAAANEFLDARERDRNAQAQRAAAYASSKLARDRFEYEKEQDKLKAAAGAGGDPEKFVGNGPDGKPMQAFSKTGATEAAQKKAGYEKYIGANRRLEQHYNEHPGASWDNWLKTSEGQAAINSVKTDMVVGYAQMNGQGALGDQERELYFKNKAGDWGNYIRSNTGRTIAKENVRNAEREYNGTMRTYINGYPKEDYHYDWTSGTWTAEKAPEVGGQGVQQVRTGGPGGYFSVKQITDTGPAIRDLYNKATSAQDPNERRKLNEERAGKLQILEGGIFSEDKLVRANAISVLATVGDQGSRQQLQRLLETESSKDKPDRDLQAQLARALGRPLDGSFHPWNEKK